MLYRLFFFGWLVTFPREDEGIRKEVSEGYEVEGRGEGKFEGLSQ